jgi:hypothetical protein
VSGCFCVSKGPRRRFQSSQLGLADSTFLMRLCRHTVQNPSKPPGNRHPTANLPGPEHPQAVPARRRGRLARRLHAAFLRARHGRHRPVAAVPGTGVAPGTVRDRHKGPGYKRDGHAWLQLRCLQACRCCAAEARFSATPNTKGRCRDPTPSRAGARGAAVRGGERACGRGNGCGESQATCNHASPGTTPHGVCWPQRPSTHCQSGLSHAGADRSPQSLSSAPPKARRLPWCSPLA